VRETDAQKIFDGPARPVNEAGKIHRGHPDDKVGQRARIDVSNESTSSLVGSNDLNILSFDQIIQSRARSGGATPWLENLRRHHCSPTLARQVPERLFREQALEGFNALKRVFRQIFEERSALGQRRANMAKASSIKRFGFVEK
jgi:hypothetical protein